ncbi:hypothetical protein QT666_22505, partial [Xanthomonas citri pv. citri]
PCSWLTESRGEFLWRTVVRVPRETSLVGVAASILAGSALGDGGLYMCAKDSFWPCSDTRPLRFT